LGPRAVSDTHVRAIPNKAKIELSDAGTLVGSLFCVVCRQEADCASECSVVVLAAWIPHARMACELSRTPIGEIFGGRE
jgi:hypothetical protein